MRLSLLALALLVSTLGAPAASMLGIEPPDSLLVVRNGYEWAWASPCAPSGGCDAGVVLHHGFVIASTADWVRDFTDETDIATAFDMGAKCASPYFSTSHDHCDIVNVTGEGGYDITIWNAPWGIGNRGYSETFVLRSAVVIPEPGTWVLLAAGLAALGLRKRLS